MEMNGVDGSTKNPLTDSSAETKRMEGLLNLIKPPLEPSGRRLGDIRSTDTQHGKIVKYKSENLRIYRALFVTSRTFLSQSETWSHLGTLTLISMTSFAFVMLTPGAEKSTPIELLDQELLGRIQTLMSFVLASYVGLCLNRYMDMRSKMGRLWSGLENTMYLSTQFMNTNSESDTKLRLTMFRWARLTFNLFFWAMQDKPNLEILRKPVAQGGLGILLPHEEALLVAGAPGHRPLIVVGWIFGVIYEKLDDRPDEHPQSMATMSRQRIVLRQTMDNLFFECRGGITQGLGFLSGPIPLMYAHIVYWTVQALLMAMAIGTGMYLAVCWVRRRNGNEGFEFDDDEVNYPEHPVQWYANVWMYRVVGNMMFALFVEGLLKVCELVENPFRDDQFGLPGIVYQTFLNNNMQSVLAGSQTYLDVLKGIDKNAFGLKGFTRENHI